MERLQAIKRSSSIDVVGKKRPVYDVHGAPPDGAVFGGVVRASWAAVGLADDPGDGKPRRVRVWMPKQAPVDIDVTWGDDWSAAVNTGGLVSFAPHDDVELVAWVDVTAGKA